MSLKKKAIKGVMWTILESWGRRIFSYIVFFTLARLLVPEDFGLIALATSFISFASIFINGGFTTALVQHSKIDPEHLDTAFWTNLALGLMFALITLGISGLIAELYHQPELKLVICWLSLTFILNAFKQVQEAILTRQLRFKVLAIRSLSVSFVGGIAGVTSAFCGLGVWSLVLQQLVGEFLNAIVLWQASNWRPGFNFSIKHLKELFVFGVNIIGISFFNFVNTNSDNLLIGYFLGPKELGYYTLAYKVFQLFLQLVSSLSQQVVFPVLCKIQTQKERLKSAFYDIIQLTSLLSFPVFLGLVVLTPEIVSVMFGENWMPIIPVMRILGFVGILHSVYSIKVSLITAMGKPSWNLWLNCVNSITNVIVFFLVVHWGIVAVASAYVIRSYMFSPFRLWMIKKLIQINLSQYLQQYNVPIIASGVMVISILGIKHFFSEILFLPALLIFCGAMGIGIYSLVIMLVAPKLFDRILNLIFLILPKSAWKKI